MKKSLFLAILLVSLILPWACSDNNNNPTKPTGSAGGGGGGGAPTPTLPPVNTPIGSGTLTPTPTFVNNFGTSANPNGMYYDGNGYLYVMEGVPSVTNMAQYPINPGTGAVGRAVIGNLFAVGVPTPGVVPPWVAPTTITLQLPIGIAYTSVPNPNGIGPPGWWGLLDSSPSGAATLYEGGNYFGWPPGCLECGWDSPNSTAGYDGINYSSPKAIVADTKGYFYVADTGNGWVDVMSLGGWSNGGVTDIEWPHRWNGSASNYLFKQPVALAIDAYDNLFVGDAGYSPSVVEEYSQLGAYLGGQWTLTPGCKINGLAVDSLANSTGEDFYVSDLNNGGQVEEYQITGPNTVLLVRTWGVTPGTPLGLLYHEYLPFAPSCIALIQAFAQPILGGPFPPPTQIIVGDTNNNLILEFGP